VPPAFGTIKRSPCLPADRQPSVIDTCPLPLDLADEVLLEGGELLQREINALDENGWNQKGEVYNATRYRVIALFAVIQDEVMELFIGTPTQFSMERVK
jgi:hypothetical protein